MDISSILRIILRWAPFLCFLASFGCTNLPDLALGACGNYVIDEGEDCDRHAESPHACADPGKANACHYTCGVLGQDCPNGYGCGGDGLCRRASGAFVAESEAEGYVWPTAIQAGDFDSDGHGDLLLLGPIDSFGYRSARALFSQGFSLHTGLNVLPTQLANPAIGAGAGAGALRDITFGDFEGVALLRGSTDRSADFAVFPTMSVPPGVHVRAVMTDALPEQGTDEFVILSTTSDGISELRGIEIGQPPVRLVQVTGSEDELVGTQPLLAAQFDETIPCSQIVLAFREATRVDVYTTCKSNGTTFGWNIGGAVVSIALQPLAKIDRGVLVKDIDVDGHLDLVIGAGDRTYVAYGLGNGEFKSQKAGGNLNEAAPYVLPLDAGGSQGFPLEIADLNADGRVDFVVDRGIVLSKDTSYELGFVNLGAPWSEAVVANLNANDWPDIVTASQGSLDIHFFNNAGNGIFGMATLPTEGLPSHMRVGDFDGDLLNDLVFSEAIAEHGELNDYVSFAFGAPFGPPELPVATGEVGKLEQIITGHIDAAIGADPMTDIGVIVEHNGGVSDSIALLPGRASRAIFSTLPLRSGPIVHLPVALTFGRFSNETPDIAALAVSRMDGRLRLLRIEAFDEEGLEIPEVSDPLPVNFIPADIVNSINLRYGATVVAADLENNGVDEVLVVGAYADREHGAIAVAKFDSSEQRFTIFPEQVFEGQVTNDSKVFVDDLDGDRNQDIVLTTGTRTDPLDLVVIWGDDSGNVPPLNESLNRIRVDGLGVTAVAALRSPTGKGKMLLVSSQKKTYLLELTAGRSWTQVEIPAIGGARAFAVVDFDRDGVEDLAAQLMDGLELFRSTPK